jgi:hypothetical protein
MNPIKSVAIAAFWMACGAVAFAVALLVWRLVF